MLSKVSYWIISHLLKGGSFLQYYPFTWDDETRTIGIKPETVYFCKFKSRNLGFRIISKVVLGNLIFGGLRILQSIYFLDKPFQDIMFNLFIFLVSCLTNCAEINTIYMPVEVAKFATEYFQYEKNLTGW